MSTITAVLEPDQDGTLRLPVPEEWKSMKIRVVATLEAAASPTDEIERDEWLAQSQRCLLKTWDNDADDVYNELLAQ